jgi:two-component system, cell cycle response regulator
VRRVLVVDDSPSVRSLLAMRLRGSGFDVDEAVDGEAGAEQAIAAPPDLVVTDLIMKGISGVQLCRVLRSDPATAHVPVVLLTGSGDKRSRFWARSAGAAAYLSKDKLDDLVGILTDLLAQAPAAPAIPAELAGRPRRTLNERMSAVLDGALFDSVIAGEVRSLATCGTLAKLFDKLVTLVSDLINYRWLAIVPGRAYAPLFAHANPEESAVLATEVRSALSIGQDRTIEVLSDPRAIAGAGGSVDILEIVFAGESIARLAVAPTSRGLSKEDKRVLSLVATELGGPLQMSALHEDAQRLATTDGLTGMLNRRAFLEIVERERLRSDRHGFPFSLMLLDIDHFKAVNDTRGHAAGDAVLKGVAAVLNAVARRTDFVARWGGEEFVVALPQTREAGARIAGERVRRAVAEAIHPVPGGDVISVTASVGISSGDAPWNQEALLVAADAAMYAAKARGRNRVEALPPSQSVGSGSRIQTAAVAK